MGLKQVQEILRQAQEKGRAVAAFDTVSYSYMDWAAQAAQKYQVPLFLMYYPNFKEVISFKEFVDFKKILQQKYEVPLIAHLDHSKSLEEIQQALEADFDSVMIDASDKSFEENVEITRKVVTCAHQVDAAVEAELGKVGSGHIVSDFMNKALYTDPKEAELFVAQTGVDSLAVAIGNSHGVYVETPHLDIEQLKEIKEAVSVPLVLHGTSLIPEEQVTQAIANGICKVNIATELYLASMKAVEDAVEKKLHEKERVFFMEKAIKPEVMAYLEAKIQLLKNEAGTL